MVESGNEQPDIRHERIDTAQTPFWEQLQKESARTYFVLTNGNQVYGTVLIVAEHYVIVGIKGRQPKMLYKHAIACVSPTEPFIEKRFQPIQEPCRAPRLRRRREPILDDIPTAPPQDDPPHAD